MPWGENSLSFGGIGRQRIPWPRDSCSSKRTGEDDPSPPARLEVGFDLLNEAYYRVSGDGVTLTGGLWQGGFHILRFPFSGGYDRTGEIAFDLDLKVAELVVRKRITVKVDVQSSPAFSLPPVAPAAGRPAPPAPRPIEGEVSLYVGDKLILTSKKLSSKPPPLKIPIPGPSPWGTKPFDRPAEGRAPVQPGLHPRRHFPGAPGH